MQRSTKIGLTILGLIIIVPWLVIFCVFVLPLIKDFNAGGKQMAAGRKYMDSLTGNDFKIWAERTQKYLFDFNSGKWENGEKNIPAKLKELKILEVNYENSNSINYVWLSGFDHTMLNVERLNNNQFKFTAVYNDGSNRVIWPTNNY